jgi:hypothetical protein
MYTGRGLLERPLLAQTRVKGLVLEWLERWLQGVGLYLDTLLVM